MRAYRPALLIAIIIVLALIGRGLGWSDATADRTVRLLAPLTGSLRAWRAKLADRSAAECSSVCAAALSGARAQPALLAAAAERELLRDENAALRSLLKFSTATTTVVTADVIGQSLIATEQNLIINQGANAGIKTGNAVIAPEGVLIGKIIAVRSQSAIVRLLQDHRSIIAALLLNPERSRGIVEGGFGAGLKMKFIPRNEIIRIGEPAVTAGLEADIPRGWLIGTVAEIENEAYQPFQQTSLAPVVDAKKLTLVGILLP